MIHRGESVCGCSWGLPWKSLVEFYLEDCLEMAVRCGYWGEETACSLFRSSGLQSSLGRYRRKMALKCPLIGDTGEETLHTHCSCHQGREKELFESVEFYLGVVLEMAQHVAITLGRGSAWSLLMYMKVLKCMALFTPWQYTCSAGGNFDWSRKWSWKTDNNICLIIWKTTYHTGDTIITWLESCL